jgi:hypothetical protein
VVDRHLQVDEGVDHRGVHARDELGVHTLFGRPRAQSFHHLPTPVGRPDGCLVSLVDGGLLDQLLALREQRNNLVAS